MYALQACHHLKGRVQADRLLLQALQGAAASDSDQDVEEPQQPTYAQEQQGLRDAFLQVRPLTHLMQLQCADLL